ncbi:MAG TPA: thioredoxin family protein [Burkholderiaceae bacterium]|nr:thioredoxin family protein [Burkholderiaceae bacterium]
MRMRQWFAAGLLASSASIATATPSIGQPAPSFRATDVAGKQVSLGDFKGKYVVLEWNNPGCPFVQKHYDSGNMQSLQKRFGAENVAWLSVNSTNETSSDYMPPAKLAAWFKQHNATPAAVLMDTKGEVGKAFGAKVTPHLYVIDPTGTLVYAGAIDDKRSTNPADVKTATNYVVAALTETKAGKPVAKSTSQAYGCTIKYASSL